MLYLIITPAFLSDKAYNTSCRKIDVSVKDSLSGSFVTADGIFSLVQNDNSKLLGEMIGNIDVEVIEKRVSEIRELESVEAYRTVDGVLHIDADQRDPVMRVITSFGNSYYIDNSGVIIQHKPGFAPRLIVVSGNVSIPDNSISSGSLDFENSGKTVKEIYDLVTFINGNTFWRSQVEQIWVNQKNEFELIPRVGNHLIKFGDGDNIDIKFRNLEALYKDALPYVGWDRYKEINLRYDGQIICKKR